MAVSMTGTKFRAWDREGSPLAFGKVYTYKARTNVPKDSFQSEDAIVENTNPVILNGEGYADIYLDGSYKIVVKDQYENEIDTTDPVSSQGGQEWINAHSATYVSPTSFKIAGNVTDKYDAGRRVRIDYGATEYAYSTILSVVFGGGESTVSVEQNTITTGIESVSASIVGTGKKWHEVPSARDTIIAFDDVEGAVVEDLEVGQIVKVKSEDAEFLVVTTASGNVGTGAYYDCHNNNQLKRIKNKKLSYKTLQDMRDNVGMAGVRDGDEISIAGRTNVGLGAVSFFYDLSDTTSSDNDSSVIVVNGLRFKLDIGWAVTSYMFGALGDGVTDDTEALQAAHNSGFHVFYLPGDYIISSPLQLRKGASVSAKAAGKFGGSTETNIAKITNNQVSGGIFWYTEDTFSGQVTAPKIQGMHLQADFPIRYNDKTADVSTGGAAQPYLMQPHVKGCVITAREAGAGIGIEMTRAFDGVIRENDISGFDINVLLCGSDINDISENRIINAYSYHILVFSTGTYGSQNTITHNDILSGKSANTVFIKTNDRHVRINDNYLEQVPSIGTIKGFIDMSATDMPDIFGVNVASISYSTIVQDNRIDGHSLVTDFVYRLNPTGLQHTIHDVGTSGIVAGLGLVIEGDLLPVRYNVSHNFVNYDFVGEQFGKWGNFKTGKTLVDGKDLTVDVEAYASLSTDAPSGDNAGDNTRYDADAIVILAAHTGVQRWYPPSVDGAVNVHFNSAYTYTVTFVAKTDSNLGDNLKMGRILDSSGDSLVTYALTEQYQEFSFTMAGAAITSKVGVYFTRNTVNGDVKIRSLTWSKV